MVDLEFPNWRQVSEWLETFVVKCHCSTERDGTSTLLCYGGKLVKEEDRFTYAGGKEKQLKFSAAGSKSVALEAVGEFKISAQCTNSLAHRCDHGHAKGMAQGFEVFRPSAKREVFRNIIRPGLLITYLLTI
ncbi:hypothetical protein FF2_025176 [Malus domestica]